MRENLDCVGGTQVVHAVASETFDAMKAERDLWKAEWAQISETARALKVDADRYRYIRNCLHRPETDLLVTSRRKSPPDCGVYSTQILDEIIDTALRASKP